MASHRAVCYKTAAHLTSKEGPMASSRRGLVTAVIGCTALVLWEQAASQTEMGIVPDRVIVVFRSLTRAADVEARVRAAGGIVLSRFDDVGIVIAAPAGGGSGDTLINRLSKDPAVLGAEYDRVLDFVAPSAAIADDP